METNIYYFSGTGNSLYIAKKIAEKMKNVQVNSIAKVERNHVINSELIGLVFPVHTYDIPVMVKEFISNTNMEKVKYIFCITTCGEKAGNTIYYLDKILKTKQKQLDYGTVIKLADNSIYYTTPEIEREKRFKEFENNLDSIVDSIYNKSGNIHLYKKSNKSEIVSFVLKKAMRYYIKDWKKEVSNEKCIHCGLCQKICPSKNISIIDNKITFGEKCVNCYGCINFCPAKAIRFGKLSLDKAPQYRCHGIKVEELF